jgi:hypothetical protein
MPSIAHELTRTPTAQWYQAARSAQQAEAWADRTRCFAAFDDILAGCRAPRVPGQRWTQQPVRLTGVLAQVQAQAGFVALETVYKRWRAPRAKQASARWAGPNPAIKPGAAFVAEAKIVAFWPYRQGCIQVADDFDMSLTEITGAYFRTLAAWASQAPVLAACEPAGAPGCASEDFAVVARRLAREMPDSADCGAVTRRLEELACHLTRKLGPGGRAAADLVRCGGEGSGGDWVVRRVAGLPDRAAAPGADGVRFAGAGRSGGLRGIAWRGIAWRGIAWRWGDGDGDRAAGVELLQPVFQVGVLLPG